MMWWRDGTDRDRTRRRGRRTWRDVCDRRAISIVKLWMMEIDRTKHSKNKYLARHDKKPIEPYNNWLLTLKNICCDNDSIHSYTFGGCCHRVCCRLRYQIYIYLGIHIYVYSSTIIIFISIFRLKGIFHDMDWVNPVDVYFGGSCLTFDRKWDL